MNPKAQTRMYNQLRKEGGLNTSDTEGIQSYHTGKDQKVLFIFYQSHTTKVRIAKD
jgi:hypothetical protein